MQLLLQFLRPLTEGLLTTTNPQAKLLVETLDTPCKCRHLLKHAVNLALKIGPSLTRDGRGGNMILETPLQLLQLPVHSAPL